jgi:diguanylate cyclase (GGDEF)-like protein
MPHRRRIPYSIIAVGIVIACALMGVCVLQLYQSRADALERAGETSRNVGLLAERDIERNIELYDLSLQAAIHNLELPNVMSAPPALRRAVLFDHAMTADYLGAILIFDEHGNIVLDSANDIPRRGNFADRRYFTIHKENPNVGLYISDPYVSRLRDGAPSIALSRRISKPDGSFGGIAVIALNLDYFHKLFAGVDLGERGAISLIGSNGVMMMRQPYDPKTIGRNISNAATFRKFQTAREGTFTETASIDGVRRIYYFKHFTKLPFIIMVAEAEDEIYAGWRSRAVIIGSLVFAFGISFIVLTLMLGAQLRHRIRAEYELELLARTDGLTGLSNRRRFAELLDAEWRRARRVRSTLSVLFIDIDRFKSYNDTYGHQAGDDALAAVARCIADNVRRPGDTAARYGGEEFIVLLPDTPEAGARQIAEKIRTAIIGLLIEHVGTELGHVTVSVGLASATPGQGADTQALIKGADEALYYAKATGRNKTVSFQDIPAASMPVAQVTVT